VREWNARDLKTNFKKINSKSQWTGEPVKTPNPQFTIDCMDEKTSVKEVNQRFPHIVSVIQRIQGIVPKTQQISAEN